MLRPGGAAIIWRLMHPTESEMVKILRTLALGLLLQAPFVMAQANPNESTQPAAGSSPTVVKKVENAVKRGASAAERGIKRGVSAAEGGVKTAASAVGRGASAAGRAIENTARRIGLPASSAASGSP